MTDAELLSEIRSLRLVSEVKQLILDRLASHQDLYPDQDIMRLPLINLLRFINDPRINLRPSIQVIIDDRKTPIHIESLPLEIQVHILRLVSNTARECVLVSKKMRILADLAFRKNIKYGPLVNPIADDPIEILKKFFEYECQELVYTTPGLYQQLQIITQRSKFTDPITKITKLARDIAFSKVDPKFENVNTNYFLVYGNTSARPCGPTRKYIGIFKFTDIVRDVDDTKLILMPVTNSTTDGLLKIINITVRLNGKSVLGYYIGHLCTAAADIESSTLITGFMRTQEMLIFLKPLQHTNVINSRIILPTIKADVSIL